MAFEIIKLTYLLTYNIASCCLQYVTTHRINIFIYLNIDNNPSLTVRHCLQNRLMSNHQVTPATKLDSFVASAV